MIDWEMLLPIIISFAVMIMIIVELIKFNENVGKVRNVRLRDDASLCEPPLAELPIIPERSCETKFGNGSTVRCYQPDENVDLVFEISAVPFFYRGVCNQLCGTINLNGTCETETDLYDKCMELLEPPSDCAVSAQPLGRLTGTNSIYYAKAVV